ncbi:MAG: DUF3825 domain-containing protein [Clostridiales bacterium]|jgi:hypothetical protein|nr:DUF3825 domain-containing protein [Clostridiales bacterium]
MKDIINVDMTKFAYLPSWYSMLNYLEELAMKEDWKFKNSCLDRINTRNPILENYIFYTFRRLADERNNVDSTEGKNKIILIHDNYACFNTGLFTSNYKEIYAYFEKNINERSNRNWFLKGFFDNHAPSLANINPLPRRARFFNSVDEIFFDGSLEIRVNTRHILNDASNRARIPYTIRNSPNISILFEGAVELGRHKAAASYHIAVPQYFQSKMQFLLPIHMLNPTKADLALAISPMNGYYIGHTCLSLDMAYSNARLIAIPETYWLKRS